MSYKFDCRPETMCYCTGQPLCFLNIIYKLIIINIFNILSSDLFSAIF